MGISINTDLIISFMTAFGSIAGALAIVWKAVLPFLERLIETKLTAIREELAQNEDKLLAINRKLESDYNSLVIGRERDRKILEALDALLAHAETGNSTGVIQEARKKLIEYLINEF